MDRGALGRTHSFRLEISMAFGAIVRALRRLLAIGMPCRGLSRRDAAALQAISAYLSATENPWLNGQPSIAAQLEPVPSMGRIGTNEIQGHLGTPDSSWNVGSKLTPAPDAAVKSIVAAMPPLTAAILTLRVHHDMSVPDIAERFAIPRWKIRMNLRHAIHIVSKMSASMGTELPG